MPQPAPDPDPYVALRDGVRAARDAAARLAAEPPRTGSGDQTPQDALTEAQALVAIVQGVRGLIPDELWAQLIELLRQVLVLLRALVDRWLARLEPPPRGAAPVVVDIPLD